jgi:DNA-directed RNA polymerase subunit beta'
MNEKLSRGQKPAEGKQIMLGITKGKSGNGFLPFRGKLPGDHQGAYRSRHSSGKTDHLVGLKENVIIGKLIPAGTGMKRYRSVKLDTDVNAAPDDEVTLSRTSDPALIDMMDEIDEPLPAEAKTGAESAKDDAPKA